MLRFLHSYPGDMSPGHLFDPGTALAVGGSLVGSYVQGQAGKSAAKKANAANAAAQQTADNYLNEGNRASVATLAPYTTAGSQATGALTDALGISGNTGAAGYGSLATPFTSSDLPTNDGYQFQLKQGEAALQRSQAANGGLLSGAAAKGLDDYTQGLASTEYQNAFNNYNTNQNNLYSRLSGVSAQGQQAAGQVASTAYNTDAAIANAALGYGASSGNNSAAATINQGSAYATGLNGLTNAAKQYAGTNGNTSTGLYSTLNNPGTANINWTGAQGLYGPGY